MTQIVIREARPGEPSLVVNFYFRLFEKQFDFLPNTEQYFLHAMEEYFENTKENRLWVAEEDGSLCGSVCIVKIGEKDAQLRLFGTDASVRGKGIGKKLLETAMNYCRQMGFLHIVLWTIDICEAALRLYADAGFVMTDTKPNVTWAAYPMTEEKWEWRENSMENVRRNED